MANNKVSIILFVTLVVLIGIFGVSMVIDNTVLRHYAQYFSRDEIVKATTIDAIKHKMSTILFGLLLVNLAAIILSRINGEILKDKFYAFLGRLKVDCVLASHARVKNILIFTLLAYFLCSCLIVIYRNDVGVDEGMYISSVKYFYEAGKFNLPWRDYAEVSLHLAYYPFFLLKPLVGFSIYSLRFVSLAYSLIMLLTLWYYTKKYYSSSAYLLLLAFLVLDPAYIYISSSGYGEMPALLSLLVGIFILTSAHRKYNPLLPAVFFALAALTKLQLLPFILFVLIMFAIFKGGARRAALLVVLHTCLLWVVGELLFALAQGYDLVGISASCWRLLNESSAMAESLPILYRLSHINAFFTASNIAIFSLIMYHYLKHFKNVQLFEKTLFVFSLLLTIWWVFFFVAMSVRNLIYVLVMNYILFVIAIMRTKDRLHKLLETKMVYGVIALFLCLSLVNTSIFNVRLISKGINDEFDYAISGYETFSRRGMESAQREFFSYINANCEPESRIYYISQDYYKYIFTDRVFLFVEHETENLALPKGSYFVLTYIDYKNDYVWDDLLIYLNASADLLFKNNSYEIYRINE